MEETTNVEVLELSSKLCIDLYDFFASNKYSFNKGRSIAGLSFYLSIKNNIELSFDYVEYLLKKILDKNIIKLHSAYRSYKEEDIVEIIANDRELLAENIRISILNKRTFPTVVTNPYHYNNNKIVNAIYKTVIKFKDTIPAKDIIRLFEAYAHLNEENVFELYKFLEDGFGAEFLKSVKNNYEKTLGLKLSIEELKKLTLNDSEPRTLKDVIKITVELLNVLRLCPSLGGENFFTVLSYQLSTMCNGYISESFIYHVILKLECMGLIHLERVNNFGERHYSLSDNLYFGIDKEQREKRMMYIINNIDEITKDVTVECPSPFKEKISNPLAFDVIKIILYIDNYSQERKLTPMEFNELIPNIIRMNSLSDEEAFKSIMYDIFKSSTLVEELWGFFKERHSVYYSFEAQSIQEITDQIKIRNKLYQRFRTSKDEKTLNRIMELDKKYMSYYSDILEEELKAVGLPMICDIIEGTVDFLKEETHCLKFYTDIIPGSVSDEKADKIHDFLINHGFEYDGKRVYEYITFQDLVVVFNVFFEKVDFYSIKTHLEDLGVNVFYSNLKDGYFSCSLNKREYDSLSKLQEWQKDELGRIYMNLN